MLVQDIRSEPVLLPTWIMAYRYRDRVYRFVANGQTGKATGHSPVSWRKFFLAVALVALAPILLTAAA